MRIILFFDLPTISKKNNRDYTRFLKVLKRNGFSIMQESVYTKLALNNSIVNSTFLELKKDLPASGIISALVITEKQFSSIKQLLGEINSDVINSENYVIKL